MIEMASGSIKRILALRMKPGEDFLLGLKRFCEEQNIKNGCILTGMGSLHSARFFDPIPIPEKKVGYGYGDPITVEGPIELVSTTGLICNDGEEVLFHIHCCFSDRTGKAYGGHLIEGNKVLLTLDMVIAEFDGIHMGREFDKELEVPLFHPSQL